MGGEVTTLTAHASTSIEKSGKINGADAISGIRGEFWHGGLDGEQRCQIGHQLEHTLLGICDDRFGLLLPPLTVIDLEIDRAGDTTLDQDLGSDLIQDTAVLHLFPLVQTTTTLNAVVAEGLVGGIDVDEADDHQAGKRLA